MTKLALLIGVSDYEPGLAALPAAIHDVDAMQQVLTHPDMGDFAADAVTVLHNPDRQRMADEIYRLFANRQKDDLVLLYFSGHGVLDDSGEFYFASRSTRKDQERLVPTTALEARSVRDWMERSRSQHKVIILDSCFSGAFAKGVKAKDSGSVNPEQFLGGKGTAILTASTSTQYALTQDGFDLSVYTHYLVEGIRTGGADQDDDGWIGMEELHGYASSKVKEAAPAMTPEFYPVKEGYKILLAKSPKDDPVLKYRKLVKQFAAEDDGNFSVVNRVYLDEWRIKQGLSPDTAATIETEELEPYRQRQAKVERYRAVFSQAIAAHYPLRDRDRTALKRLQDLLSLRDEDITAIETPLLVDAEQERLIEEERKRQKLAELEKQRQAERQARAQQAELERQRQAELERQRQTPEPPPRPKPAPQKATQTVEIETLSIIGLEKTGLLGMGKPKVLTQSRRLQVEIYTEALGNGVRLELVQIPSGRFPMGSQEKNSETPRHRVTVPAFWMGQYPVTQAQYEAVMGNNPSNFKGANRPVEKVSWHDAIAFCTKLSQQTGNIYRLPSEAEWEYACRAGTTTPFYFGDVITTDFVNYHGNYQYNNSPRGQYREQTTEVGIFPPNAFGLYDMHGNVWEWCQDHWYDNYEGAPTDGSAWINKAVEEDTTRVVRGGSWIDYPRGCRSATRFNYYPRISLNLIGFRVVCSAPRT